ncbi:transcriptional activator RinB [Staphylococcus hominis]|uniref:transcriptional activator RinB n=1 Tax=Staphylococcus hominis TaxID=1290 RepID=UPI00287B4288|nr:transcriptional regulator [Staphylococcus hominis]MDS3898403.1 transcriptional regulator [Staphylococcus hominis]
MIKKLVKLITLASISVLGVYLTRYMIVILESEDDIDTAPKDFASEWDQYDLNRIKAEVSE